MTCSPQAPSDRLRVIRLQATLTTVPVTVTLLQLLRGGGSPTVTGAAARAGPLQPEAGLMSPSRLEVQLPESDYDRDRYVTVTVTAAAGTEWRDGPSAGPRPEIATPRKDRFKHA